MLLIIYFRFKEHCISHSILELWEFDPQRINALDSSSEIVAYLSSVKRSPVFNNPYVAKDWIGDLVYNADGHIISAKAAKMAYVIKATSGDEYNTMIQVTQMFNWQHFFVILGLLHKLLAPHCAVLCCTVLRSDFFMNF